MARKSKRKLLFRDDPLWYKDAIIYELHVRAFCDSDGDGIGDFPGLTSKLDYLRELGVTALWLLPFYPSPLRDDGYDIADYGDVHPDYGTLRDFKTFLREAHDRGLRVITELVINHTSDQHEWFQRARKARPGSAHRDYYVWSDTPDRYQETRIIFQDFESSNWSWDPVAQAYYWHRFYSHQPDLNFESQAVRRAVKQTLDFWFNMGVDGLRLDAVPYLYEEEHSNCENLPQTHAYLKDLRRYVNQRHKNRMFLAEANQWPEDASAYFGDGDECHMAFHFPLMPRLFMAVRMESRFPIVEILEQTPSIPDNCQWAIFLRNHDELTLEMVTDEERDYMYRNYAHDPQMRINLGIRRRLAPLLGNDRRRIELLTALLFSLPGTPVLYYGDEIGMGDNVYLGDRNGVRTPMQWNADRNAGFSRASAQRLYLPAIIEPEYHHQAVNVEAQHQNPHSLLWWMRRVIAVRARYQAFGRGTLTFLNPENPKALAFVREYEDERIVVVANLSRYPQHVTLDLSDFAGVVPVEVFGRTPFPPIDAEPYAVTLGPHAFFWFTLNQPGVEDVAIEERERSVPRIAVHDGWDSVFDDELRGQFERHLVPYLKPRRWFGGKALKLQGCRVTDVITLSRTLRVLLVQADYVDGEPDTYQVPVSFAKGEVAEEIRKTWPGSIIVSVEGPREVGIIYDAPFDREFAELMLASIQKRRQFSGVHGKVKASGLRPLKSLMADGNLEPAVSAAEQSNTSIFYGDRLVLKLFRRLDSGVNPDLEIGRFLTTRARFEHTPATAGYLEYSRDRRSQPTTLGIVQAYIPNEGDAWSYTLDTLGRYFERALAERQDDGTPEVQTIHGLLLDDRDIPEHAEEMIAPYIGDAALLGQRTAQMHIALAGSDADQAFSRQSFTSLYQRSIYQSMRSQAKRALELLRKSTSSIPADARPVANQVLDVESDLVKLFEALRKRKLSAARIRTHGDFHLGQLLFTGKDFVIMDFEGEPTRSISERRLKRSPLRDVAGMLRSFHYAVAMARSRLITSDSGTSPATNPEDRERLEHWGRYWYAWVSAAYLKSYLATCDTDTFLPKTQEELRILLDAYLLEKAIYEVVYELNNRPQWVRIPLEGILSLLETGDEESVRS